MGRPWIPPWWELHLRRFSLGATLLSYVGVFVSVRIDIQGRYGRFRCEAAFGRGGGGREQGQFEDYIQTGCVVHILPRNISTKRQ